MTKTDLHKLLMTVWVQWPHVPVSIVMTDLWYEAFYSEPIDSFRTALMATVKNSKSGFPPTIGEVNHMLLSLSQNTADNLTEGEAYRIIITAIRRFGHYQEKEGLAYLEEIDPRLRQAAQAMGWRDICAWQTDDEPANRAHLWRVFLGIKDRDLKHDLLGKPRMDIDYKHTNGLTKIGDISKKLLD